MKLWGYKGLMDHFSSIRSFYKERRDMMVKLAESHLRGEFQPTMSTRQVNRRWAEEGIH